MSNESQENKDTKKLLQTLVELNKAIVKQQYRALALKVHSQKKIKLINPDDPQYFYLN